MFFYKTVKLNKKYISLKMLQVHIEKSVRFAGGGGWQGLPPLDEDDLPGGGGGGGQKLWSEGGLRPLQAADQFQQNIHH